MSPTTMPHPKQAHSKQAQSSYELHPLLAQRWSPRAFKPDPLDTTTLGSLLEAARWAPSCFNEQPWRLFVGSAAHNPNTLATLQDLLVEGNAWAKQAPVLLLAAAEGYFKRNGLPNAHAMHDVGLALAQVTLQAEALGLKAHLMAGFKAQQASEVLLLPPSCQPVVMMAIGYQGDTEQLKEAWQREAEEAPRVRQAFSEWVFDAHYGQTFSALEG